MRQHRARNHEHPAALPAVGVLSEEEGRQLLVVAGVLGYGPVSGRYLLPRFYDPEVPELRSVDRIFTAGRYLAELRDWLRKPHAERGRIPASPFSPPHLEIQP